MEARVKLREDDRKTVVFTDIIHLWHESINH